MELPPRKYPPLGPPKLSPRERALAEWRGVDGSGLRKRDSTQAIGGVMPKVLKALRMDQRCAEAEIARVWRHLIDPNVTAHAQPTGLRKGTLFVTVDSSVWLDEIVRFRRKEILERLRNSFGREVIARISFRLG